MITKTNSLNNINEITLTNLENGEVTLEQLNEIYNKMGFVFVANKGRFTKIRKEIKHLLLKQPFIPELRLRSFIKYCIL